MTHGNTLQDVLALIGRLLMGYFLVPEGWSKITGFAATVAYIAGKGVPMPEVCAAIAIAAELGLGLLLLFGWKTRWAALGLAAYIAVITPIFHNYWALPAAQVMAQKISFGKNIAIIGGLLAFAAFGAGRFSFDRASRQNLSDGETSYGNP